MAVKYLAPADWTVFGLKVGSELCSIAVRFQSAAALAGSLQPSIFHWSWWEAACRIKLSHDLITSTV